VKLLLLLLACGVMQAQRIPQAPPMGDGPHTAPAYRVWIEGWKKPFVIRETVLQDQGDLHVDDEQCGREGNCAAVTHCADQLIVYDPYMPLQEVKITILHEIQHAVTFCTNTVQLTHQFIYALSGPLFKTFSDKRNKELTKWLFGY
jgi:hypothetical protein